MQFFQTLNQLQRAQLYLGAFDYSGEVIRDPDSAHFLGDEKFVSDVFPPYARGAGVVITLDLVRKFVEEDRKKRLTRLRVEDASYGLYLHLQRSSTTAMRFTTPGGKIQSESIMGCSQ